MNRRVKWLLVAAVAAVLVFVGGPFVYINLIKEDAPPALSFDEVGGASTTAAAATTTDATAAAAAAAATDGLDGAWTATSASIVGYRVQEVLFGQSTEGVGRTSAVTGTLTLQGTTASAARFTIDMATVTSDESRRDSAFRGRIMDVSTFPTATFALTAPIDLGGIPADKQQVTAKATGDLTLKGTTRRVTFDLVARRNGATIEVNGSIPVTFADFGIDNPSMSGITTKDNGLLEFLLVFGR
jgi:polyisoprenoid-binding protein YceI